MARVLIHGAKHLERLFIVIYHCIATYIVGRVCSRVCCNSTYVILIMYNLLMYLVFQLSVVIELTCNIVRRTELVH